jgi:hypothetical protein
LITITENPCSRVVAEKVIVTYLAKKNHVLYGTGRFIAGLPGLAAADRPSQPNSVSPSTIVALRSILTLKTYVRLELPIVLLP